MDFRIFVFAPCTFSTLNFLYGTNGWWDHNARASKKRLRIERIYFQSKPRRIRNRLLEGDRKPNPGSITFIFLSLSLYPHRLRVRVESLPRKRRLISRGKRAALNFSAGGEKGGTIALAKTRDSITSKTWGKRAVRSAWSQINSSFAMMVPRGEKHRSIFFSSPFFSLSSLFLFSYFFFLFHRFAFDGTFNRFRWSEKRCTRRQLHQINHRNITARA